jgi:anti-anti-sigma factor
MQGIGTIMDIEKRETTTADLLTLRGELDLTNARELADALAATPAETVILDLSELAFLDSAGIRAIDGARSRFELDGRRLLIVAPPESRAGWTFKVAGLADGTVLESVEAAEALASSDGGAG